MSMDPRYGQNRTGKPVPTPAPAVHRPPAPAVHRGVDMPHTPSPTPRPAIPTPRPAPPDDAGHHDEDQPLTLLRLLRRLQPAPVILAIGSLGALFFLIRAVTSHTTPTAVLLSAGVVNGLIFGADTVLSAVAMWRAGQRGEIRRALLLAFIGGISCLLSFGAWAGVLVLTLLLNG